uniref:Uncharacterized protein n=1 Tax=Triticum urartu TaxID=4572 RepID=A0A8R7PFE3_TRIUA
MDRTNAAAAAPPPVPMAAPVVPVDLTVVKKLLGGGGDLAVHDASGGLAFRVTAADGCGRRCGGRALLDASGSTLVTARTSEVMIPAWASALVNLILSERFHHHQVNLAS